MPLCQRGGYRLLVHLLAVYLLLVIAQQGAAYLAHHPVDVRIRVQIVLFLPVADAVHGTLVVVEAGRLRHYPHPADAFGARRILDDNRFAGRGLGSVEHVPSWVQSLVVMAWPPGVAAGGDAL